MWFGVANVIANALIMLRFVDEIQALSLDYLLTRLRSSVVLWVAQNMEEDYTYSVTL